MKKEGCPVLLTGEEHVGKYGGDQGQVSDAAGAERHQQVERGQDRRRRRADRIRHRREELARPVVDGRDARRRVQKVLQQLLLPKRNINFIIMCSLLSLISFQTSKVFIESKLKN